MDSACWHHHGLERSQLLGVPERPNDDSLIATIITRSTQTVQVLGEPPDYALTTIRKLGQPRHSLASHRREVIGRAMQCAQPASF